MTDVKIVNTLRLDQVLAKTGLNKDSLYLGMRFNDFPKYFTIATDESLSPIWDESEVDNWIRKIELRTKGIYKRKE